MSFDLSKFQLERVLNEDPISRSVTLLGKYPESLTSSSTTLAIVRIEKTALPSFSDDLVEKIKQIETNDIYTWLFGWLASSEERPDVKINVICPATEIHIKKYSTQKVYLVHETPALYEQIVKPYIDGFPASRTKWCAISFRTLGRIQLKKKCFGFSRVTDILSGYSEADKVLYRSSATTDPDEGFLILPDMKWDLKTVSSLYLVAISLSPNIRSLRDLERRHLGMLKKIRKEARRAVREGWGLEESEVKCYVHYQPSYYHFHVHIVNANYNGLAGMAVAQAHLLDDIISLLELEADNSTAPSALQRMTLTYGLGDQHGLFEPMRAAQAEFADDD